MALFEMHYRSKALKKEVTLNVILPELENENPGSNYRTVYLLHGLSGDHTDWIRRTCIERYAAKYGVAVVMPEVGRSWYSDTAYGANYFTFVSKELPEVCRGYFKGMSDKREDNFVAGLSMGGYGAMKIALTYAESFGGCASLSGSLDITRRNRPYTLEEWQGNFDFAMKDAIELENTKHDIFHLTDELYKSGKQFPKIYLWCGTEDTLITINRKYRDTLTDLNIPHRYEESEGDHTWKWWDLHIQDAFEYLFN